MLLQYSVLKACRRAKPRPYEGPGNKFWELVKEAGIVTAFCHICLTVAILTEVFHIRSLLEPPACHAQLSVPCASFFGYQTAASLFTC